MGGGSPKEKRVSIIQAPFFRVEADAQADAAQSGGASGGEFAPPLKVVAESAYEGAGEFYFHGADEVSE
jgi:hypothetical protein